MSETASRIHFRDETNPVASVIILGYRRAPLLLGCLRALAHSVRDVPYEVVLVLNQPERELVDEVERHVSGARVLRTRVNLGFGGAVNLAAAEARGEFLVLLNDDTEVTNDWLETLVDTARRRPQAGAVGSTMLFPDGRIQEAASVIWHDGSTLTVGRGLPGDSRKYDYERKVDFSSGGSLLVRREVFDRLGGMDPAFFPAYYEDADFCLRMAELGWETWYQPRSRVMHYESMSTNETYRGFLFARNKAMFVARWAAVLEQREPAAPGDPEALERAVRAAMGSPKRVLFIDDQVADASIGSGYPRMVDTFHTILASGRYHLVLFTSLIDGSSNNELACELGIEIVEGFSQEDLEEHLSSLAVPYDAFVVSRPHNFERFADIIRRLQPGAPVVYDAEALFHRRIERQAQLTGASEISAEAAAMRSLEGEIASQADLVVTISEDEAAFMGSHSEHPVRVHSPLLRGVRPHPRGYGERSDIAFVAGWAWGVLTPNVDALQWFARDVLPGVLGRAPGTRLLVTGSNAPENVLRLAGPSIVFTGRVADLEDFYSKVRVVIVPMRYGSGVKIKTIEALQFGVPTVATSVGAEGIGLDVPDCLIVEDDASRFASTVSALLLNPRAWDLQRARILAQHRHWPEAEPSSVWPGVLDELLSRPAVSAT